MEKEVVKAYKEIGNVRKLAKIFKCRTSKISNILKKNGVKIVMGGRGKNRKHFFDENFLFNLENETTLYWLGFLAADGYINKLGYISLELAEKDKNHVELFKHDIKTTAPICKKIIENSKRNKKYNDSINYGIRICSKNLVQKLKKYNLIENKSHRIKIPKCIINCGENIRHYLRGYVDGDGGWKIQKNNQLYLKIRGSKQFLKQISEIFKQYCIKNPRHKKISFDSGTYMLQYNGNNVCKEIHDWLYDNCERFMERKAHIIMVK